MRRFSLGETLNSECWACLGFWKSFGERWKLRLSKGLLKQTMGVCELFLRRWLFCEARLKTRNQQGQHSLLGYLLRTCRSPALTSPPGQDSKIPQGWNFFSGSLVIFETLVNFTSTIPALIGSEQIMIFALLTSLDCYLEK